MATTPLWGDLSPGPHAVGLRVERWHSATGRDLELVRWYPARATPGGRSVTLADYLRLAPELTESTPTDSGAPGTVWSTLVTGASDGITYETASRLALTPSYAVWDAPAVAGARPLAMWSARHGTPLYQGILSEYLASHGFIVAYTRFSGKRLAYPYEGVSAATRRAALEAHVGDLQLSLQRLQRDSSVTPGSIAVLAWSYGGEVATELQDREPQVGLVVGLSTNALANWVYRPGEEPTPSRAVRLRARFVLLSEAVAPNGVRRTAPVALRHLPAGGCFVRFGGLAHGNFNALEGFIPSLLGIARVQPWSSAGSTARDGFVSIAALVRDVLQTGGNSLLAIDTRGGEETLSLRVPATMQCAGRRNAP